MKKIWDRQSNQALYAIDEEALHNKVLKKKDKAVRMAGRSEKVMIKSLLFGFTIIAGASVYKSDYELFASLLAVVMLLMAGLIYSKRRKRLAWQNTFDRSVLGDMDKAIANARYQVQLSKFSRSVYIVVATLTVASVVDTVDEWWKGAVISVFFVATYFAARWEHKTFYVSQRNNLEAMRDKLERLQSEEPQNMEPDQYI